MVLSYFECVTSGKCNWNGMICCNYCECIVLQVNVLTNVQTVDKSTCGAAVSSCTHASTQVTYFHTIHLLCLIIKIIMKRTIFTVLKSSPRTESLHEFTRFTQWMQNSARRLPTFGPSRRTRAISTLAPVSTWMGDCLSWYSSSSSSSTFYNTL